MQISALGIARQRSIRTVTKHPLHHVAQNILHRQCAGFGYPRFLHSVFYSLLQNIPRIPRPSPESLKTVIDQMAETDPKVAALKPEQFIDGRFFAELEKEGFIQKLWK